MPLSAAGLNPQLLPPYRPRSHLPECDLGYDVAVPWALVLRRLHTSTFAPPQSPNSSCDSVWIPRSEYLFSVIDGNSVQTLGFGGGVNQPGEDCAEVGFEDREVRCCSSVDIVSGCRSSLFGPPHCSRIPRVEEPTRRPMKKGARRTPTVCSGRRAHRNSLIPDAFHV